MKNFKNWFRLFGILLFLYIIWTTDWSKVLEAVRGLRWELVALSVACFIPVIGAKAWRWQYLLHMQGITLPFGTAYHAYFASVYLGNVTPGRAGDFLKVFYLTQKQAVTLGKGFSSVLVDRLFDLMVLLLLGLLGVALYRTSREIVMLVVISFVVLSILAGVLLSRRLSRPIFQLFFERSFLKRFHGKASQQVADFFDGIQSLKQPSLLAPFLISVLSYIFFFTITYLLAVAMNLHIPLPYLVLTITIVNVVSILPISVMGVGVREAVLIPLFAAQGLPQAVAVAYSMLIFVVLGLIASSFGAWSWFHHPLNLQAQENIE